ncbi:MAG: helix-turn-helix domain-containing protein [Anaeromyxobacter sp.]|nr:helix-turn-helix domain-containing protein [Anaeromyxobacter sp.]
MAAVVDDGLWTAKETAAFLKVSVSWTYLHAAAGTLPSVRILGLRRFLPAQIKAFAAGQPVPTSNILSFPVDRAAR